MPGFDAPETNPLRLENALRLLNLHEIDERSLSEEDVRYAKDQKMAELTNTVRELSRKDGLRFRNLEAKYRKRLRKISPAQDVVVEWLRERQATANTSSQSPVKPGKIPTAQTIKFTGLSDDEETYARRFYQLGVCRIRDAGVFLNEYRNGAGIFAELDSDLTALLRLEDLTETGLSARLCQLGWPFPESEDSQREFAGAIPVIRFIRGLIGEPKQPIEDPRRLLIEASCLYADDTQSESPSSVDIEMLSDYVDKHASDQFQLWDKLQLVLCYFLGIENDGHRTANSNFTLLYRLQENIEEIETKLGKLTQEINPSNVKAAEKKEFTVTISPHDLRNELLGPLTIADAVVTGSSLSPPPESIPYFIRQFDVLQRTPVLSHAYIGRIERLTSVSAPKGDLSLLERNLVRHRIASWLSMDCRAASWHDARPVIDKKSDEGKVNEDLIGTTRIGFLPLGDYISLSLGFPTTGAFVVSNAPSSRRSKLALRYAARSHTDTLVSGLVGGGTEPMLFRGAVAHCSGCRQALLNLKCVGEECQNYGSHPTGFITQDMLIIRDDSLFMPLSCATSQHGRFEIADFTSDRRKLATVYFAATSGGEIDRQSGLDHVDFVERQCQEKLIQRFPEILKALDSVSINGVNKPICSVGTVIRHLLALPTPNQAKRIRAWEEYDRRGPAPSLPSRRTWNWIRADAGDFSSWPPAMPTADLLKKTTNHAFWKAVADVVRKNQFADALLAMIPSVQDRIVCLRHLTVYPKDETWHARYARPVNDKKILDSIGIELQSDAAAQDQVIEIVAQSWLDWLIPGLEHPWLTFQNYAEKKSACFPWKEFGEIQNWWSSLTAAEQRARTKVIKDKTVVRLLQEFLACEEVHESLTKYSSEEQDRLNQVGMGLWILSWWELRKHLYDEMERLPPNADTDEPIEEIQKGAQS